MYGSVDNTYFNIYTVFLGFNIDNLCNLYNPRQYQNMISLDECYMMIGYAAISGLGFGFLIMAFRSAYRRGNKA
jgi:hypothetical protein